MNAIRIFIIFMTITHVSFASPFYPMKRDTMQSVVFKRLSDGKIIFESNPNTALSPASVTKLFTSAAVLSQFSPAHKFSTRMYYSGSKKDGIIAGDLIIVGDGDPLLISEKLWQMAADFRHMGVLKIQGDIIIDNSIFDGKAFDDSRADSRHKSTNAYDAPVSAFGVNFNTFPVAFYPGYKAGDKSIMSIDPYPIKGIEINNKVITKNHRNTKLRVTRTSEKDSDKVVATGIINTKSELKKLYRSVSDPVTMGGEQIRAFLKAEGINVTGSIKSGLLPEKATHLYTIESYEVARMISGLNKYSNNYIADVLIKRLGAEHPTKSDKIHSGSLENGMAVLQNFLKNEVGINSNLKLYNGSGLDPRNRVSASHVIALLEYMYKRMDLFPEFLASLSASGWDGTLEDRFDKAGMKDIRGQVRAKTGTLTNPITVSSLAGYMGHPKHGMIVFAIIENGIPNKKQPSILALRKRQESALKIIVDRF